MPHPLANDPNTPESLRRLFARVTCKVVHRFDDGSESSVNCLSAAQAETQAAESRVLIGTGRFRPMPRPDGSAGPERRLVSVTVEPI